MQQFIEIMKWCFVIIAVIMLGGVIVAFRTGSAVHTAAVKVQAEIEKVRTDVGRVINEVKEVEDGVELLRESLRNPMQSIGNAFGKELTPNFKTSSATSSVRANSS